jgi:hypothetical protein
MFRETDRIDGTLRRQTKRLWELISDIEGDEV